jgi:hypothetical protein
MYALPRPMVMSAHVFAPAVTFPRVQASIHYIFPLFESFCVPFHQSYICTFDYKNMLWLAKDTSIPH